jgi:DnaJ-domain-containing protein 1
MSREARRRLLQVESNTRNQFGYLECTFTLNVRKIKSAYRKAALKYHPDKAAGDEDKFKKLGQAVEQVLASTKTLLLLYPELETNVLA